VSGASWRPTGRANLAAILAGGVFLVGANAFLFVGQQTVPSGVAAIMQSLVPIATSLWALGLLPEERLSAVGAVGIGLGFLGVVLIVRPDPANLLGDRVVGRLFIAVQVAGVSLGGVLIQRARPTLDNAALSGWSMLLGGLLLHAASAALGEPFALPATPRTGAAVGYLGVFATGLAFAIYFHLLETRGAVETSLVAYLVPVVATVVGVVVLEESTTAWTLLGFLVVFAGFLVLKRRAIRALASGTTVPTRGPDD
jgi:drug/metabolite transporter (DMT)-like permease